MFPTVYKSVMVDGHPGVEPERDYPRDALVKVAATGAACILIHRSVLLRMLMPHPNGFGTFPNGDPNPYPWFVEGVSHGRPFGEDIAFCQNAARIGIPTHVDTRIKIGHVKTAELTEAEYDRRRAEREVLV
jgi:hypothetical protein